MANKNLFVAATKNNQPAADTTNNAGGKAYSMPAKIKIANICCTGCFNDTFYVSAKTQLDSLLELCKQINDYEFLCKLAIYSRTNAYMKDMPSFLLAYLCANIKTPEQMHLFKTTFFKVCDNIKMIRNFVQIIRSGVVGRKSLGTMPKRLICDWLNSKNDEALFRMSIGNDPSMSDVLKLTHPKPATPTREALYGYLTGNKYNMEMLPNLVKEFEIFKQTLDSHQIPNVPFEMLTALNLSPECWKAIAVNASWTATRMNLNTFQRHGVFDDNKITKQIINKLTNETLIRNAKVFPYQLLTAANNIGEALPLKIKNALQDAIEIAVDNVPQIDGEVIVCIDVSGSMTTPVTGNRGTATSSVSCVDVAALFGSVMLRKNPNCTTVIPFDTAVRLDVSINPKDSIMTNANKLSVHGGGTNCTVPLEWMNSRKAQADLVIFVSDNESWVDGGYPGRHNNKTNFMNQWNLFKKNNPQARLVTIDLVPNSTSQTSPSKDILQIGGFSDTVFDTIKAFYENKNNDPTFWVKYIEETVIIE